jgi:uncharacterized protein (DUF433 family)
MTKTEMAHIWLDEKGTAWIDETGIKVIEVVLSHLAYGWSPAEIHFQYPHLSLAQIHAALAYYYDHQEALDAQIERDLQEVEAMMQQAQESPIQKKFRKRKAQRSKGAAS